MEQSGPRMQYVDALRGVSILLVVLHHVFGKMGPVMALPSALALRETFASFLMPLFFFLSGYFAYRAADRWTAGKLRDVFSKKVCAQIIGTAVFATIFCLWFDIDIPAFFSNIGDGEYWFTVVLFQMFVLYILLMLLTRGLRRGDRIFTALTIVLATVMYAVNICLTVSHNCIQLCNFTDACGWGKLTFFFPYFAIGLLARGSGTRLFRLMTRRFFSFVNVAVFLLCLIFISDIDYTSKGKLLHLACGVSGVLTLFMLFYGSRRYFDSGRALPRVMSFVGRRTLDIYFIHYLFLPDLAFIPIEVYGTNPALPLLVIGLGVSAAVTAAALAVSRVIRVSPTLSLLLFGSRQQ